MTKNEKLKLNYLQRNVRNGKDRISTRDCWAFFPRKVRMFGRGSFQKKQVVLLLKQGVLLLKWRNWNTSLSHSLRWALRIGLEKGRWLTNRLMKGWKNPMISLLTLTSTIGELPCPLWKMSWRVYNSVVQYNTVVLSSAGMCKSLSFEYEEFVSKKTWNVRHILLNIWMKESMLGRSLISGSEWLHHDHWITVSSDSEMLKYCQYGS